MVIENKFSFIFCLSNIINNVNDMEMTTLKLHFGKHHLIISFLSYDSYTFPTILSINTSRVIVTQWASSIKTSSVIFCILFCFYFINKILSFSICNNKKIKKNALNLLSFNIKSVSFFLSL